MFNESLHVQHSLNLALTSLDLLLQSFVTTASTAKVKEPVDYLKFETLVSLG